MSTRSQLPRRQKPLNNRTQLALYRGDVEDAVDYVAETAEQADGTTVLIHGVEKHESNVNIISFSPFVLLLPHLDARGSHLFRFVGGEQVEKNGTRGR